MTLNPTRCKHIKYLPYAFIENGIAMPGSVLRSSTAIEANIKIMRTFVAMHHFFSNNAHLLDAFIKVKQRFGRKGDGKGAYAALREAYFGNETSTQEKHLCTILMTYLEQ